MELKKWKAVKHFQDNWDIEADNFPAMLKLSIKKTFNLLKSGQYFPLKMILNFAEKEPETIRGLFKRLYDEEVNLDERIAYFQAVSEEMRIKYYPDKNNTYQDQRAIIVYLTLKYPEVYYLFKFEMFRSFSKKLRLTFKPKAGEFETLLHYHKLCSILRYHISQDQELLKLHKERITDDCYYDENLHILTQDFIYAVAEHLENTNTATNTITKLKTNFGSLLATELTNKIDKFDFTPRFVNFIENSIEAKRIGDLGELWVYAHEKLKLTSGGQSILADKVKLIPNTNGDGAGYDIESYDLNGKRIFIEVKTTTGSFNTTFFISRTELERSKKEKDNYFLYRVYNLNEETNYAECKIIQGDLSSICDNPATYKISLVTS